MTGAFIGKSKHIKWKCYVLGLFDYSLVLYTLTFIDSEAGKMDKRKLFFTVRIFFILFLDLVLGLTLNKKSLKQKLQFN